MNQGMQNFYELTQKLQSTFPSELHQQSVMLAQISPRYSATGVTVSGFDINLLDVVALAQNIVDTNG